MERSRSQKQISFLLTAAEQRALVAWARTKFPDERIGGHEAARAIVLQRLVVDGALNSDGKLIAAVQTRAPVTVSGARLRAERDKRALTQAELASILGVPRSTLALWEGGAKKVPSRLAAVVDRWIVSAEAPDVGELEKREPRSRWQRLVDDDVLPDDDP